MIKTPVICVDGGDIMVFPSVKYAASWIEPQDVEDVEIYDAEGHRLEMKAGMVSIEHHCLWIRWTSIHRGTIITERTPATNDTSFLRGKLIGYLEASRKKGHSSEELQNDSLSTLVVKAGERMPWKMDQ